LSAEANNLQPADLGGRPCRLIVLGSTGSIGVNTLAVASHLNNTGAMDIEIVGLAANANADLVIAQAKTHSVKHLAIADAACADQVREALPGVTVFSGDTASAELVKQVECTDVAAAIVGIAGLEPTLEAVKLGRRIHLSNKETLVAAGSLITSLVQHHNAQIIPVDSEHSAIFQCLAGRDASWVKSIVLTASGGALRDMPSDQRDNATRDEALNHPNWDMGPKVTIDSATMMNKALEVIEAHWLFGLPADRIRAVIHPQSIVHSFVEMIDGSVLAQLGPPDMKTPIHVALTWPARAASCSKQLDFAEMSRLDFAPASEDQFPALALAAAAINTGGTAGAILNAANEVAVQAFLDGQISFGRITALVAEAMATIESCPADSLDAILDADRNTRCWANERLAQTPLATKAHTTD